MAAKAELSRCVTQAGYEVGSGGMFCTSRTSLGIVLKIVLEAYRNEKLDVSDWTVPQSESDDMDEDEDDDEDS